MENETNQVEHKTMKLLEDILTEDEIYDISERIEFPLMRKTIGFHHTFHTF